MSWVERFLDKLLKMWDWEPPEPLEHDQEREPTLVYVIGQDALGACTCDACKDFEVLYQTDQHRV